MCDFFFFFLPWYLRIISFDKSLRGGVAKGRQTGLSGLKLQALLVVY